MLTEAQERSEAVFTETLQVGIVVRDLEAAMKTYVERYGIGPWEVFDMNPNTTSELEKDERPVDHSIRVALTMVGAVQWELIEPIGGPNIYSEWMEKHGEGLHHLGVGVPDYRKTIDLMHERGERILQSGNLQGARYAYPSTESDLGFITEIFDFPDGTQLIPTSYYPPREAE